MERGLAHPFIPFGEGVTGQWVCHRPALGVPPLIAGAWGVEWGPQRGAGALCAAGPVPCRAPGLSVLMHVGYLGPLLAQDPPPLVSWHCPAQPWGPSWEGRVRTGVWPLGRLDVASPGQAAMADAGLSRRRVSHPV